MAKLLIRTADGPETVHELESEVVLGRDAGADLQVTDLKVSRKHCRFYQILGAWTVEDLGSSNGIKINGKPATRHTLSGGDRVTMGSTVVVYELPEQKRFKAPVRKSARERLNRD